MMAVAGIDPDPDAAEAALPALVTAFRARLY